MEIKGKIVQVLPEVSGVAKSTGNPWKKREYVLETQDAYPKKVMFNLFGERADQYPCNIGDEVTVSFDLESREFNGRWYTDVRAWKVERGNGAAAPVAPVAGAPAGIPESSAPIPPADSADDLPF